MCVCTFSSPFSSFTTRQWWRAVEELTLTPEQILRVDADKLVNLFSINRGAAWSLPSGSRATSGCRYRVLLPSQSRGWKGGKITHCIEHKSRILYNTRFKNSSSGKAGSYSEKEKRQNELSCMWVRACATLLLPWQRAPIGKSEGINISFFRSLLNLNISICKKPRMHVWP